MYSHLRNLVKYLCIISASSSLYAADNKDSANINNGELSRHDLQKLEKTIKTASERRKSTIKSYAKETGMTHLPMIFASDAEIKAKYANQSEDDVVDLSEKPTLQESDSDSELVPIYTRLKKTKNTKKRKRATEELSDSEEETLTEAPPLKIYKGKDGPVSLPKFKTTTSMHANPQIGALKGTIIVYDSETSALSPKCGGRFVELAAIKIVDGVPSETLHILLNPDMKSWAGAFKAHGLHESYLRAQAHFYDVAKQIEDFFGQDIRCAHNGFKFDDPYLNFEITRARIFWQLRQMLTPQQDFMNTVPTSALLSSDIAQKGHTILKEFGLVSDTTVQENLQEKANLLASAAMLYFYKDHMSKVTTGTDTEPKPGPLMFRDGKIMPDSETYPENHEAAVARLAWFRLIRQDTDTFEQRALLKHPYPKFIRDAIQSSEVYLSAIVKIFEKNILDEATFKIAPLDPTKMFDTLVHVRNHQQQFTRAVTVDNHKLDSLIDYYHLNRHARETGTHGAAIDTSLLYQVLRKLVGAQDATNPALQTLLSKSQTEIEELLFEKNSIRHFDEAGQVTATIRLHDDQISGTTHDRNGRRNVGVNLAAEIPQNLAIPQIPAANMNGAEQFGGGMNPLAMIPPAAFGMPYGFPFPMMGYNPLMMQQMMQQPYPQAIPFNPFAAANPQMPATYQMSPYSSMGAQPRQPR